MLLSFGPSIFVVDQVATLTSTSILMLMGFGAFVFAADQITTSISILMLLGSWPFRCC
jgi:hypothetical protein